MPVGGKNPKGRGATTGPSIHRLIASGWDTAHIVETLRCSRRTVQRHLRRACKCTPEELEVVGDRGGELAPLAPIVEKLRDHLGMPGLTAVEVDALYRPIAEFYRKVMYPGDITITMDEVRAISRNGKALPPGMNTDQFIRTAGGLAAMERQVALAEAARMKSTGVNKARVVELVDQISTHQRRLMDRRDYQDWLSWLRALLETRFGELL